MADDPGAVADAVESRPAIDEFHGPYVDDRRTIAQYEAIEQRLYEFLWESSLPPEFQVVVEDGGMEFDVTATREQFQASGTAPDESDRRYELLSVGTTEEGGRAPHRAPTRVPGRRAPPGVLRGATGVGAGGARRVPRGRPSTASGTIRRGTGRVVRQFLIGRDDRPR